MAQYKYVKSAMWLEVSNHPTLPQSLLIVGFFRKQLYNIIFDEPKIILLNKNLHINTLTLLKKFWISSGKKVIITKICTWQLQYETSKIHTDLYDGICCRSSQFILIKSCICFSKPGFTFEYVNIWITPLYTSI